MEYSLMGIPFQISAIAMMITAVAGLFEPRWGFLTLLCLATVQVVFF